MLNPLQEQRSFTPGSLNILKSPREQKKKKKRIGCVSISSSVILPACSGAVITGGESLDILILLDCAGCIVNLLLY